MGAPVGQLTRGTTGRNRLRRCDRWLVHSPRVRTALQSAADPLVVDLGYGALPVTTLELATRLRAVRSDVRVIGLEIDPDRVRAAQAARDDAVGFGSPSTARRTSPSAFRKSLSTTMSRVSRSTRYWPRPIARGPASPATACSDRASGGAPC